MKITLYFCQFPGMKILVAWQSVVIFKLFIRLHSVCMFFANYYLFIPYAKTSALLLNMQTVKLDNFTMRTNAIINPEFLMEQQFLYQKQGAIHSLSVYVSQTVENIKILDEKIQDGTGDVEVDVSFCSELARVRRSHTVHVRVSMATGRCFSHKVLWALCRRTHPASWRFDSTPGSSVV